MNLFEANKKNVSKNEMDNYVNNKLSHKEKHDIEKAMQEDAFLADAMEGFEKFPNEINNIPKLKTAKTKAFFIGGTIAIIAILLSLYLFNKQNNTREFTPITFNNNTDSKTTKTNEEFPNKKEVLTEQEISKTVNNTSTKKSKTSNEKIPFVRETISLETYTADPEIHSQELHYNIEKTKTKTIAYYNFLAVDYSVIYIDETPFEEIEIGTPASQSNSDSYNLTDEHVLSKKTKYSYKEYLKKSLKLLSEKKYSNAISNFNTILKHYPNDVNAQFYIGFAHFNLNNYNTAIPYFNKTMDNSFDFFFEDAQWYKALSLENHGKYKEAKKLYQEIAKAKGFYASQALEK